MNHTPGPWKAFDNGHYHDVHVSQNEGDEEITETSPSIASVMQDRTRNHTKGREREAANARLIAAAPELLFALETAKHDWENRTDLLFGYSTYKLICDAIAKVKEENQ